MSRGLGDVYKRQAWLRLCCMPCATKMKPGRLWLLVLSSMRMRPSSPHCQEPASGWRQPYWSSLAKIVTASHQRHHSRRWPAPVRSPIRAVRSVQSAFAAVATISSVTSFSSGLAAQRFNLTGLLPTDTRSLLAIALAAAPTALWPTVCSPLPGNSGRHGLPMMKLSICRTV